MIGVLELVEYIGHYIKAYREEYARFSADMFGTNPEFAPSISPYVSSNKLHIVKGSDGVLIIDESREPSHSWFIAGGPAMMVDYEPSVTHPIITKTLKENGILGKNIGIYRVVSKRQLPAYIWKGRLSNQIELEVLELDNLVVSVKSFNYSINELLNIITFGALGRVLDLHLPTASSDFWIPHSITNMGFFPADLNNKRFINYLEIIPHLDGAAWDKRNITIRVIVDVRRDFASFFGGGGGGNISMGITQNYREFYDKLSLYKKLIDEFERLLFTEHNGDESIFHEFLLKNNILLDPYGEIVSKVRLCYPSGEISPLGKKYVEPDFIVKYHNMHYKLIEIEKPAKNLRTKQGQPRAEFTQAAFQIAEWNDYIDNHYNEVRDKFPGICSNRKSMLIIGSDNDIQSDARYKKMLHGHLKVDEILTYSDLLVNAKLHYAKLSNLPLAHFPPST